MGNNVSIVIVNWNSRKLLTRCLNSISKYNPLLLKNTLIIDNNSKDSKKLVLLKKKYKKINSILNKKNYRFAKAVNMELEKVKQRVLPS